MNPPRILWAAPFCLHDSSSGAAANLRNMLEKLVERGVEVRVLSALTFDSPKGTTMFPNFEEQRDKTEHDFLTIESNGITYQYLKTKSIRIDDMTRGEENKFLIRYYDTVWAFKPDAIMQFGGAPLELAIRIDAQRRGMAVLFALMNGNYRTDSFRHIDLLFTTSNAGCEAYAKHSRANVHNTGIFIQPAHALAAKRDPKYITFINPTPEKGAAVVVAIAQAMRQTMPQQRFLVVQSRGCWFAALKHFGFSKDDFPNVDVTENMANMRPVYEVTKLLLVPSLWYELFGMVAAEACMNGIPVVAYKNGGLPEAVGDGGICIDPVVDVIKNSDKLPAPEHVQPWLKAIQQILDPFAYGDWSRRAKKAAEAHDIEKSTDRTLKLFMPFLDKKRSLNANYLK